MSLISIDFSINSTAICVLNKGELHWFSFASNLDFNKKAFSVHNDLDGLGMNIHGYTREKPKDLDYVQEQSWKINNANYISYNIINAIAPYVDEDTMFAIEGFSYGSRGNAFIDLITYNTFLKSKILRISKKDILVYPPKTIKKFFTGNGNANKEKMLEAFKISEDELLLNDPFHKYILDTNYGDKIPKPVDDLVDAFAILCYLRDGCNSDA